jgi:hypothetical protein
MALHGASATYAAGPAPCRAAAANAGTHSSAHCAPSSFDRLAAAKTAFILFWTRVILHARCELRGLMIEVYRIQTDANVWWPATADFAAPYSLTCLLTYLLHN